MSFVSPLFLWGFGLLAPLVAVYLLRVRPRRHPVPAIFLWDEIFAQRKATALFQRLRDLLSLLMLALAAAALIVAASRPRFESADDRDTLLLIDRSASMSADADPAHPGLSRFDAAVDRARDLVKSLGGERRMAIATVDQHISFATYLTAEPRRLRDALDTLTPGQGPNADAALDGLSQVADLGDELRVVLLTDGVGVSVPGTDDGSQTPAPADADAASDAASPPDALTAGGIETLRIGLPEVPGNIGLTGADLVVADAHTLTLFLTASSSFTAPVQAEAVLTAMHRDGDTWSDTGPPVKVIPLALAPGANTAHVLSVSAGPGRYRLALTRSAPDTDSNAGPDALALDNTAYLSVPEPQPLRVAVNAQDRYFLETAVASFAQSSGLFTLVGADDRADLTLARGAAPTTADAPPLRVVFAPDQPGPGVTAVGEPLTHVLPRALLPTHPVLRLLPAESLPFAGAVSATPAPGSAVLVADVTGAPLLWQHRDADTSSVTLVVNLDPAAADFVLSPYFPVLVHAAATHLGGRTHPPSATFATGDRAPIPALRPGDTARVRFADQSTAQATAGDAVHLTHAGFHSVDAVNQSPYAGPDLPASALHAAESGLHSSLSPDLPEVTLPGGHPPWLWLTLLALGVIVAEEMLYHRRKVG